MVGWDKDDPLLQNRDAEERHGWWIGKGKYLRKVGFSSSAPTPSLFILQIFIGIDKYLHSITMCQLLF